MLSTRRDVGAGLRPERLGSPTASAALATPVGFALRLHRGMLTGFGAGLFLMGAMYGSVLGEAEDMLQGIDEIEEALARLGGASVVESFASMVMVVLTVVAAVYVVMAALRPRAEETAGRAEPLLATGLSRSRWVGGHLAVAMGGGTVVLLLAGLGFGVAGAASTGDAGLLPDWWARPSRTRPHCGSRPVWPWCSSAGSHGRSRRPGSCRCTPSWSATSARSSSSPAG
ncbi:ABC transporter membrane-spanning protein [Streptomyces griseoflavus Tu4000]|uniref:ABC transporter membrane-spanning protein n=1 Tax=Streptomyces griseoflavus Tu4000 TaxID=467200 RepID=D9XJU4_9ACTN|nr:ABC transporter membrane-spanning protein [Streptomyces griseoflavus Tu4000]